MADWFLKVKKDFITCFLEKDRWHYILQGLGNTLKIALVAVLLGVVIGTVVAIIRSITYIQAMPLLIVAALYLAMVMFFSSLVTRLERRLRGSER